MTVKWGHLLPSLAFGIASYHLGSVAFWSNHLNELLSVHSIFAAAILVRLARGAPLGSTESISVTDARKLSSMTKTLVRRLRALLLVILVSMGLLIFSPTLLDLADLYLAKNAGIVPRLDKILSMLIAFLIAFSALRVLSVASSDVELADLQTENLISCACEKQKAETEEILKQGRSTEKKSSRGGYGKLMQ